MTSATPALVTRDAARRLPRWALWILLGLYLLPGLFGRDPWRNVDLITYGVMKAMADGRIDWWSPSLGGLPVDVALLPHWLGAICISALAPLGVYEPLAARLPFAALLGGSFALVWYGAYYLARTEAAQPVAFAFGGEASPKDYARALADASILALMAALGLLQVGHETTPEIAELFSVSLIVWALAVASFHPRRAAFTLIVALPLLAASGAPALALALGAVAALVAWRSEQPGLRRLLPVLLAGMLAAAVCGGVFKTWLWRAEPLSEFEDVRRVLTLLLWFTWPIGLMALWTLWRWRRQLHRRHMAAPALVGVLCVATCVAMGGNDRALMLALPALAILAAFALPTLQRSSSAAIDWFSVFFFSAMAVVLWLIYTSFQLGWPQAPALSAARYAPDYRSHFSVWPLAMAVAGSVAWLWLVRWRTSRHQKALWKSLVLPAGGVALNWLLGMTLLLHPLDYTRSLSPWVAALQPHLREADCICAPDMAPAYVAALEAHGHWIVDARPDSASKPTCGWMLLTEDREITPTAPAGWLYVTRVRRPTEQYYGALIFKRAAPALKAASD